MASFFDEIAKNRVTSILLFLIFGALFSGIVYLLVVLFGGGLFGLAVGTVIVVAYALFAYSMGDKMVLALSGAKEVTQQQYPNLYDVVEGLASANQIPVPKIYVINDPNPNAFATGKGKKASAIAVTSGLLSMMNKNELEGVLAHETSHILDGDILVMMVAIVFAGAIGIIAALVRNALWFGGFGNNRNNGGILVLVAIVVGLLAPLFALLIRLAISRRREYMADANGARIIRNPSALASALKKIQAYSASPKTAPMKHANEITANLYFSSPFKPRSMLNLFSTHPPIEERIKRLEAMY